MSVVEQHHGYYKSIKIPILCHIWSGSPVDSARDIMSTLQQDLLTSVTCWGAVFPTDWNSHR